jgi:hypothetical protein
MYFNPVFSFLCRTVHSSLLASNRKPAALKGKKRVWIFWLKGKARAIYNWGAPFPRQVVFFPSRLVGASFLVLHILSVCGGDGDKRFASPVLFCTVLRFQPIQSVGPVTPKRILLTIYIFFLNPNGTDTVQEIDRAALYD